MGPVLQEVFLGDLVDAVDVARVAGASPRSVVRWRTGDVSPRRETEERLLELKAVLNLARRVFRDDVARQWLRSPVPDLDYEKPLELVAAGDWRRVLGAMLVDHLAAMKLDHGGWGLAVSGLLFQGCCFKRI